MPWHRDYTSNAGVQVMLFADRLEVWNPGELPRFRQPAAGEGRSPISDLAGRHIMSEPAKKKATYQDLCDLPENLIGEIINGEIIATPRPSVRHTHAASILGGEIVPPYQLGRGGGPGGWVILSETEVLLGEHLLVPDFAGWI